MTKKGRGTSEKKRRAFTKHRGVKIVARTLPSGATRYRMVWNDPDLGRAVAKTLKERSAAARRDRAIQKARELEQRRRELDEGALPRANTSVKDAVDLYLKAQRPRLAARTIEGYEDTLRGFQLWAANAKIASTDALDRPRLARYRDWVIAIRVTRAADGGKRGERRATEERISAASINRRLRETGAFLHYLRTRGYAPRLDRDAIADGVKGERGLRRAACPLTAAQCIALLEAALRHDAATFKLTRKQHAEAPSVLERNTEPRHGPVAPFVAFVLLTGCRLGEALALRWSDVHLDAPDDFGASAGEVRLQATATKTRTERRIDLSVSPGLREILRVLKAKAGEATHVFGGDAALAHEHAHNARARLVETYGAPAFSWQRLRQTCASFLTNAPGIFRAASIYRSAEQLGHSPEVARRHYLGAIRGISPSARTLDDALLVGPLLGHIGRATSADNADVPALPLRRAATA